MDESTTQMQKRRYSFSAMEFWLLLAAVAGGEFLIVWFSFINASDENLMNVINFASTLSSILLAVVAIIYSYYQSDAQQRSSHSIASEVSRMTEASREIRGTATVLDAGLGQLKEIEAKIHSAVSDLQNNVGSKLDRLEGKLADAFAYQERRPASPVEKILSKDAIKALVQSFVVFELGAVLQASSSPGQPIRALAGLFAQATHEFFRPSEDISAAPDPFFEGYYQGVFGVLMSLGLVQCDANGVIKSVDATLLEEVRKRADGQSEEKARKFLTRVQEKRC